MCCTTSSARPSAEWSCSSTPFRKYGEAPREPRRPAGKARGGRIPGVCNRRAPRRRSQEKLRSQAERGRVATPPDGMDRLSNATVFAEWGTKPRRGPRISRMRLGARRSWRKCSQVQGEAKLWRSRHSSSLRSSSPAASSESRAGLNGAGPAGCWQKTEPAIGSGVRRRIRFPGPGVIRRSN